MSAERSSTPKTEIADLYIPRKLGKVARALDHHPGRECLRVVRDHFVHEGPNGSHLCLVSQLAGPSILSMAECPGRVSGSRRLRGDLARRVARQAATAVELLHSAGFVHGDLTSSNILFRVSDQVHKWSTDDIYETLGRPEMEEVVKCNGPPGPCAPAQVVAPISTSRLCSPSLLREDVVLIDFDHSFFAGRPPPHYAPATPVHYLSPEALFDANASPASDVWALACTLFEIRAGAPLFDPFLGGDALLKQVVETLGRLPERWWSAWAARTAWFDETGAPRPEEEQRREGVLLLAVAGPLRQNLREVGQWYDCSPDGNEGRMIEKTRTRLGEAEVELLADLLGKMLRYRPGDRIAMTEVVRHPWFGDFAPRPAPEAVDRSCTGGTLGL